MGWHGLSLPLVGRQCVHNKRQRKKIIHKAIEHTHSDTEMHPISGNCTVQIGVVVHQFENVIPAILLAISGATCVGNCA